MAWIVILAFLAVFAITVALAYAFSSGSSRDAKRVAAVLDSALATDSEKSTEINLDFRKSDMLSAVPWLNRQLLKLDLAERMQSLLRQSGLKWTAGRLILLSLAAFAGAFYLIHFRTGSMVFSLLCGLAIGSAPFGYVCIKRQQRFAKFEKALPDALDLIVSALRVGQSLMAAINLVSRECPDPLASEFRTCSEEQNFGLELRVALENLIARVPLQDLRIAVTAILIQKESGGNLSEVLEKAAYVTRQRFRLKRQIQVHTAQGRLTGMVLTVLPIALAIGLYIINPSTMSLLWTRPIGIKLMFLAGAMLVVGSLIIQKIVRMDV